MQRAERRLAQREGRAVRTLMESDYLLGVADETRLGALRFRRAGDEEFLAKPRSGVPPLVKLGALLESTGRILRDEETDEDLQLIFAPGSSLGGARPKASVIDAHGRLSIAKFPKETDDYSIETWEEIALRLAERAGIKTAEHQLLRVAGKAVLLSRRFDRVDTRRIPFLSAMAMMGARDGEGGSYPEMVDVLSACGARPPRMLICKAASMSLGSGKVASRASQRDWNAALSGASARWMFCARCSATVAMHAASRFGA
jgi:serine/threonine-protein kinase HipA